MKQLCCWIVVLAVLLGGCGEKKSPPQCPVIRWVSRDAKAKQSVYALKRDSAAVRAFDEAFRSYLKEKDRPLYNSIFPEENKKR